MIIDEPAIEDAIHWATARYQDEPYPDEDALAFLVTNAKQIKHEMLGKYKEFLDEQEMFLAEHGMSLTDLVKRELDITIYGEPQEGRWAE